MNRIRLGRTNLSITRWGLGGITLSTVMGGTTPETISQIIHAALDRGINFIDTSRAYLDCETNMGEVMQTRRRECFLASKTISRTRQGALADVKESLLQLQTDNIEVYQIHALKPPEVAAVMGDDGALAGLKQAREQGLIDHIGLTSHHVDVLAELVVTGEFDTVMFPYNVIEREPEKKLLGLCRKHDIGTIVMKPLAGGAITNREWAFRFFNQADVDLILNGVGNVAELEENLIHAASEIPLSPEALRAFEKQVEPLGSDFCRRCSYCMPCPNDIMIPDMIHVIYQSVQNIAYADLSDEKKAVGETLIPWLDACEECGQCQQRCPYDLPTIKRKNALMEKFKQ